MSHFKLLNFNKRESISGRPLLISPTSPRESPDIIVKNGNLSPTRADIECYDETFWHSPFSLQPSLINAYYFWPELKYLAELERLFSFVSTFIGGEVSC